MPSEDRNGSGTEGRRPFARRGPRRILRTRIAGEPSGTVPPAPAPGGSAERRATSHLARHRRLLIAAILAPIVFVGILEWARDLLYPSLQTLPGRLLMDGLVLAGLLFFYGAVFTMFGAMQDRLARRNRELLALHRAALDIYGDLALDAVLQKVVAQARRLLDARYGAISVIDEEGRIQSFVTSGITDEGRARIGSPPEGRGLLGVVLREGEHLRLAEILADPRSVGFPPNHPRMHSLLAVPITAKGPFRGNLYLADRESAAEFSEEDEETLVRFATAAAIAIDNAHLHQRLRGLAVAEERLRLAHEMHDGLAQVLAYVNTKLQAVGELLRKGRDEQAKQQLAELAGTAREVYDDVREGILGLRMSSSGDGGLGHALRRYAEHWEDQSGLAVEVETDDTLRFDPAVEIQLMRIAQEALTNVRKHARASRARLTLLRLPGEAVLTIADDGAGFHPGGSHRGDLPRFGLATMRERAESIGARLALDSTPGRGTRIEVTLPIPVLPGTGERRTYASPDR